jgi:hypothetical protein
VEVLPGLPVIDLGDLSGDQLLDAVQGWERVVAVATAAQAACLVALRDRIAQADDAQACAARAGVTTQQQLTEEVALALHLSPVAAAGRLDLAEGLGVLPATGAALLAGGLGVAHARVLVDVLTGLLPAPPSHVVRHIDRVVCGAAIEHGLTPRQVRARVRRLLLALDPDGAVAPAGRGARAQRVVPPRPARHGVALGLPTCARGTGVPAGTRRARTQATGR